MTIEWDSDGFLAGLAEALGEVDAIGKEQARAVAGNATARMRSTVPVLTGETRASIRFRTLRDAEGEFVEFGPRTEAARFLEYGTERQSPHPFIRPAIEAAVAEEWPT